MNAHNLISLADAEKLAAVAAAKRLPIFTAQDLGDMEFPPVKFVVEGYLPEGCTILAGRPKLGKSWLCLEIAIAVATGGDCLGGVTCEKGDVLYLALEDNQRRLRDRIQKMCPARGIDPWPRRLSLATEWARSESGGVEAIRTWAEGCDNARLVIVDVLAQFREGRGNQESLYESDYGAVKGLQQLAGDMGLAIVIVHHVRKGSSDVDPFERVSGTMGLTGAADTVIVLDRGTSGCTLYCRGRDIQEYERAVTFDKFTCRWIAQGEVSEVRRTDERSAILDVLKDADEAMTVKDITTATGLNRNSCDQLLFKMAKAGEVLKVKRGNYVHPERGDLVPDYPIHTNKIDKKVRNREWETD